MRGDGGVAGEGRVVGVPKFHSWDKWTLILTNINSDWMSKASPVYYILYYLRGFLSCILGCNITTVYYCVCMRNVNFYH